MSLFIFCCDLEYGANEHWFAYVEASTLDEGIKKLIDHEAGDSGPEYNRDLEIWKDEVISEWFEIKDGIPVNSSYKERSKEDWNLIK